MIATTPRERPMLFSDEMAAAVWDERKQQTRRMIKQLQCGQRRRFIYHEGRVWGSLDFQEYDPITKRTIYGGPAYLASDCSYYSPVVIGGGPGKALTCPYGQPGDRLWVRESFLPCKGSGFPCRPADARYVCFRDGAQQFREGAYHPWPLTTEPDWSKHRFSPSIHLPRWAARSLLEITEVRVELLLSISHGDAIAEGIARVAQLGVLRACGWKDYSGQTPGFLSPVDSFCSLWQKINGADAWRADQWVWVVSFRKVK